jgi:dTDP-glucose 4,6-dehydratase
MGEILVTGGAGFIGSHFVEHVLENTDWNITVLDSLTYAGDLHRLGDVDVFDRKRVKFFYHNLQSSITEEKDKKLPRFDYVAHFAAESHVENSLHDPVAFAASNVVGTTHLLNYLRVYQPQVKAIVNVSTDEVYGPAPDGVFYKEWSTIKPSNPYSASKAGQDAMAYAFYNAFKMPIMTTRTMNNFGERQHPEKFVSLVMRKVLNHEPVQIHGNGSQIGSRCWLHARNHADGVLFLLRNHRDEFNGDIFQRGKYNAHVTTVAGGSRYVIFRKTAD